VFIFKQRIIDIGDKSDRILAKNNGNLSLPIIYKDFILESIQITYAAILPSNLDKAWKSGPKSNSGLYQEYRRTLVSARATCLSCVRAPSFVRFCWPGISLKRRSWDAFSSSVARLRFHAAVSP
jgi:hypothetical protein